MKQTLGLGLMFLLFLSSCNLDNEQKGPWIPVLEDTGFEHLSTTGTRILEHLQDSRQSLTNGDRPAVQESLDAAVAAVEVLVYYEIPMTEVRQNIYDAGRLYALEQFGNVQAHLERAEYTLDGIIQHGPPAVEGAVREVRLMIEDLLFTYNETIQPGRPVKSALLAEKFRKVGNKVNTMALKADLVLSGAQFPVTD